eukprot:1181362-Prorocentrum_minimum.AAC.3
MPPQIDPLKSSCDTKRYLSCILQAIAVWRAVFLGKECPDEVKVLVLGPFYMTRRLPDRREGTAAIRVVGGAEVSPRRITRGQIPDVSINIVRHRGALMLGEEATTN